MLALVTQGLSNQEIAETLYLSINSVKTYIRSTYRKMGVATRSQAVLWAIQHWSRRQNYPTRPQTSRASRPRTGAEGRARPRQAIDDPT